MLLRVHATFYNYLLIVLFFLALFIAGIFLKRKGWLPVLYYTIPVFMFFFIYLHATMHGDEHGVFVFPLDTFHIHIYKEFLYEAIWKALMVVLFIYSIVNLCIRKNPLSLKIVSIAVLAIYVLTIILIFIFVPLGKIGG